MLVKSVSRCLTQTILHENRAHSPSDLFFLAFLFCMLFDLALSWENKEALTSLCPSPLALSPLRNGHSDFCKLIELAGENPKPVFLI